MYIYYHHFVKFLIFYFPLIYKYQRLTQFGLFMFAKQICYRCIADICLLAKWKASQIYHVLFTKRWSLQPKANPFLIPITSFKHSAVRDRSARWWIRFARRAMRSPPCSQDHKSNMFTAPRRILIFLDLASAT